LWPDLWPYQGGNPDGHGGSWELFSDNGQANTVATGSQNQGMARCVIGRHKGKAPVGAKTTVTGATVPLWSGGVDVSCADGHSEYTSLDNLWGYYWNFGEVPQARPAH
jgi:hypothetical protein